VRERGKEWGWREGGGGEKEREGGRRREKLLFHMLCSFNSLYRPQYFKMLDQCTAQIVLHKSGVDPDFHYTKKFNVDVDNLIGMDTVYTT
jgi:hypothetical protein